MVLTLEKVVKAKALPLGSSAQEAEVTALTRALLLPEGTWMVRTEAPALRSLWWLLTGPSPAEKEAPCVGQ